ncbi:ABC transporter permease [Microbacterium sp. LRZ72]|uniref:ABC transporter permease n=1 Tax=Microbacterium sp. LRZ72 TaxID=2942481 RepID=UPI0029AD68E4|nr:ABC transporter permease subunit [Microbacterium sp. LRZ72]MDX2377250.1 ABC transporter permease [Microbacterium sp. LRZ72]
MTDFFSGMATVAGLELRQRVRSVAWYVLLAIFAVLLLAVTLLAGMVFSSSPNQFRGAYSVVVYIVLLLVTLVSPALSGNAINGDRDQATLAPVQVTLVSTPQIIAGKFVAAWATGLAFAVVAVPFIGFTSLAGGVPFGAVAASIAVLVVEIGVIAAFGVALSGILNRPLFSVVTTYLVVAALTVGTLIAFGLGGAAVRTEVVDQHRSYVYDSSGMPTTDPPTCGPWQQTVRETPRFDRVWWMLAANPFVILADATPIAFGPEGYPVDTFGQISVAVRSAQLPPEGSVWDDCDRSGWGQNAETPEQVHARTVPSWFAGLGIQIVLAGGALVWAGMRTRTPAARLPRGSRIA